MIFITIICLEQFYFWCPEQELVEKAEAWLERATDAAGSRAPLKKLRELLHAGVRLGADVPQVRLCCLRAAGPGWRCGRALPLLAAVPPRQG